MDIFSVLTLIGGLCLFLFGMNVMSGGLERVGGNRMESILEKLTSNRFAAVAVGAGITAVIQSSSATTVMVVGFVNSGIMKLSQAIGLIMGANIGTTVTAWLLSLTSINGSGILLQFCKPSSFTPILAVIGIILYMTGKNSSKKDIGEILLGFAVLMGGMETMSAAVEPLKDMPEFTQLLTVFDNPFMGIVVGAVVTGVIQSSSASVGILQALSVTGAFTYGSVIPIIMGQNIGTCVTAIISCLSGNRSAKRTAIVHLYFNIIGTIVFLSLYFGIDAVIGFAFTDKIVSAGSIALIHSIFNIFTTVILLPFTKGLEKLAYITLPVSKEEKLAAEKASRFNMLNDRHLSNPGFVLPHVKELTVELSDISKQSVDLAMDMLFEYSDENFDKLEDLENTSDMYADKLSAYLGKLSGTNLGAKGGQSVNFLQHSITDFERICDLSINIGELARSIKKSESGFSAEGMAELTTYSQAIKDIMGRAQAAYANNDVAMAMTIEPLEEVVDELNKRTNKNHVKRLRSGQCSIEIGMLLSDITTHMERIGDHCSNIAIYELQLNDSSISEHTYYEQMEPKNTEAFRSKVEEFRQQYHY